MEDLLHPHALLADAASGRLAGLDRTRLDEHLAGCAECRTELATVKRALTALASLRDETVEVPASVSALVVREARNRVTSKGARPARWAAGLAAAAIVAAAAVVTLPGGGDDSGGGAMKATEVSAPENNTMAGDGVADAAMPDATDESLQNLADVASQAPLPDEPIDYSGPQLDCLTAELDSDFLASGQVPIQILNARYEGKDALVGTFILEKNGSRMATVRVVDAATCLGMATFLGLSG